MQPLADLPSGVFRVIYHFNVREMYRRLQDRCSQFLDRYHALQQTYSHQRVPHICPHYFNVEGLVQLWFEHHLRRNSFVELRPHVSPWSRSSLFHNEILLGCPMEERILYAMVHSVAQEHITHQASVTLSPKDLTLTFDLRY